MDGPLCIGFFRRGERFKAFTDGMLFCDYSIRSKAAVTFRHGDVFIIPFENWIPVPVIMTKKVFTVLAGFFHWIFPSSTVVFRLVLQNNRRLSYFVFCFLLWDICNDHELCCESVPLALCSAGQSICSFCMCFPLETFPLRLI